MIVSLLSLILFGAHATNTQSATIVSARAPVVTSTRFGRIVTIGDSMFAVTEDSYLPSLGRKLNTTAVSNARSGAGMRAISRQGACSADPECKWLVMNDAPAAQCGSPEWMIEFDDLLKRELDAGRKVIIVGYPTFMKTEGNPAKYEEVMDIFAGAADNDSVWFVDPRQNPIWQSGLGMYARDGKHPHPLYGGQVFAEEVAKIIVAESTTASSTTAVAGTTLEVAMGTTTTTSLATVSTTTLEYLMADAGALCSQQGLVDVPESNCHAACKSQGYTNYRPGSWSHSPKCFAVVSGQWQGNCHWNTNARAGAHGNANRALCVRTTTGSSSTSSSTTTIIITTSMTTASSPQATTVPKSTSTMVPPPLQILPAGSHTWTIRQSWSQGTHARRVDVLVAGAGGRIIIGLHGAGGSGRPSSYTQYVEGDNYIVAAPTGYGRKWNCGREPTKAPDVAFIEGIVDKLKSYANADVSAGVTVIGHSNGCAMIVRLLAESQRAELARFACKNSMLNHDDHDAMHFRKLDGSIAAPLTSGRKVWFFHGEADPIVPFEGGRGILGYNFWGGVKSSQLVAELYGVADSPSTMHFGQTTVITYGSSQPVVMWSANGVGHGCCPGEEARIKISKLVMNTSLSTSTTSPVMSSTTTTTPTGRLHEECWNAGGCKDDGASVCSWCGKHDGQTMYCCRRGWLYGPEKKCHNADFAQADGHRCVAVASTSSTTTPATMASTSMTTSTGTVASSFSPADGGENRACRGATPGDNSATYYNLEMGHSEEACKTLCVDLPGCVGIELNSHGRCEVWTRPDGIGATAAVPGYHCLRYGTPTVGSTTTSPSLPGFSYADGGVDRACRGSTAADNSATYYQVEIRIPNLDACKALCVERPGCVGIEFHSRGRCEVWTRSEGIGATAGVLGYRCLRYVPPSALSQSGGKLRGAGKIASAHRFLLAPAIMGNVFIQGCSATSKMQAETSEGFCRV